MFIYLSALDKLLKQHFVVFQSKNNVSKTGAELRVDPVIAKTIILILLDIIF